MSLLLHTCRTTRRGEQFARAVRLVVSAAAVWVPVLAEAQQIAGSKEYRSAALEEVIVTAQKRSENLRDVPVPVTAITAETLTGNNQLRVEDYYSKVPGLSLTVQGGGGEPTIAIRGVTTGSTSNPTVGIVVDEVPYGGSVTTTNVAVTAPDIDPGDLARVEVLRGPQGTLYGASSIGGLLKFVTVDPSTEDLSSHVTVGSTSVRHSGDLGSSVRGWVNVPLGDSLAVRASGFRIRDPGYIDNIETGQRDVNNRESDGGRLSALWRPSDAFSLKVSALIQESERGGVSEVDTAFGAERFQQRFLVGTGLYERKTEAYSATMTGKLGAVEITSATGYSVDKSSNNIDSTSVPLLRTFSELLFGGGRAVTSVKRQVKKFSQEIRASVPLTDRVDWLVGVFYTDEKNEVPADNQAADSSGRLLGSLFLNAYGPSSYKEYAAFTNLTVGITDRFDIQVGGRFSDNKQEIPASWSGPIADIIFHENPFFAHAPRSRDSAFTYLLTPRFRISPDFMAYLRLASGYRPGGPNLACGHSGVPCSYDADRTQNYDIGIKGSALQGALSFDASLYYIDWKDIQIADLITSDFLFFYTDNVSRAKSQGIELSVEARSQSNFVVSAWAAYNEATLDADLPPGPFLAVGRSGDRLPYGSRLSGSVSADREFPLWGTATGSLGASLAYVGDRKGKFQIPGVNRETFPSYTQLDARAALKYDTWEANLFVTNATDKRGVLRSGMDSNAPTFFTYIQPRTVGLSLSKTF